MKMIFTYWCKYLMQKGNISKSEMLNVFNCGFRFLMIIDKEIEKYFDDLNFDFKVVGNIY